MITRIALMSLRDTSSVGRNTWAAALMLAAGAVALAGCEKASDPEVRTAVESGSARLGGGLPAEAAQVLQPASQTQTAPGGTLAVKFALGHAKLDQAREKAVKLTDLYIDIARLEGEIAQITSTVALGNTLVEGYRKQDPAAARQLIRTRLAEARGGPDKAVWIDTGKLPIPTLSAAKQQVSSLQERVAAKQEEIKKLEAERAGAIRNADALAEKVDGLRGREAVDAYAAASNARKAVSLVSSRIDVAQGELVTLERDAAVAAGQLGVVEKYITSLEAQDKQLADRFGQIGQQIGAQQAVSKAAVEAQSELASSITAKVDELNKLLDEANKTFAEAEELYKAAEAAYGSAFNEATSQRGELQARMANYSGKSAFDEKMLRSLSNGTWPSVYRIQQGIALKGLGDLQARRAEGLATRERLTALVGPVVQAAGLTAPAALSTDPAALKSARDAAAESYQKAVTELEGAADNIQGQDPERRRMAAHVARTFALYEWSRLLAASGDEAGAAAKLDEAKKARDAVATEADGKAPVALPPELAITPAAKPADAAPQQ